MARKKKTSIIEVAAEAGVSRSTVSRVINNDPRAAADTVKAVQIAMAKLDYTPPPMEKRYRRPSRKPQGIHNGNVALFFPDVDPNAEHTYLSSQLIRGASVALSQHNLGMLVTHMPAPDSAPEVIVNRKVDGIIIRNGDMTDTVLRKVKKIPTVWIFEADRRKPWGDQVAPDNQAAGEMAAQWLIDQKKKNFIIYIGDAQQIEFRRRYQSCANALESWGRTAHIINDQAVPAGKFGQTVKELGPDTALFICAQDQTIIHAMAELQQLTAGAGCTIPTIAVTNNIIMIRSIYPALANIDIQSEHLAKVAVETLLWRMKNPREPSRVVNIAPRLDA